MLIKLKVGCLRREIPLRQIQALEGTYVEMVNLGGLKLGPLFLALAVLPKEQWKQLAVYAAVTLFLLAGLA
jgi:hypothetical protein